MGIDIKRAKGQLKRTQPTDDSVICFIFSGTAVAGKIALSEPKQIFSTDDLTALGITADNNAVAFRDITDFYGLAGQGAELNFMLVSNATTLEDICDLTKSFASKLLDFTKGRGVIFLVNKDFAAGYTPTITNGLDADVTAGISKANLLAQQYDNNNVPFVAVLPAFGITKDSVAQLAERSTLSNDYVGFCAACEKADGHISMGVLAAWLANAQVSQNAGRVLFGKVTDTGFFPDGTDVSDLKNQYDTLDGKGLIYFQTIPALSGCFFNDDPTATAVTSDYSSVSWNRTINKAKRITYSSLVLKLRDDVQLNPSTGNIETSVLSDWESDVENAVRGNMINVEAGKVPEISGVKCSIDPNSDIVNDKINATLSIVRNGQVKNISVSIGYVTSIQQ